MYEAWGLVEGCWVQGFEIGIDGETGLYVFFENLRRTKHYLKESELNYSKEKPE